MLRERPHRQGQLVDFESKVPINIIFIFKISLMMHQLLVVFLIFDASKFKFRNYNKRFLLESKRPSKPPTSFATKLLTLGITCSSFGRSFIQRNLILLSL